MFKKLFYLFICIGCLVYGVLIGKYRVFPYSILKNLQDNTEELETNKLEDIVYSWDEKKNLVSAYPHNQDSLRAELKKIIFGKLDLSTLKVKSVNTKNNHTFQDIPNLTKTEEFMVLQKFNIQSIGYIFHPSSSNNRALFYHQGHSGDFSLGKNTIAHFLNEGFTIYAFSMPIKGKNNHPIIDIPKIGKIQLSNHEEFKYLDHPLQYFIAPVITMINHAESQGFEDINMVGVSGGGWTTTLVAALDNRLSNSFPVAGSYPMFVRYQEASRNYGDFEQTYPDLYSNINYLDLYILGAVGKARSQLQISNKYDPCCYGGDAYKQYDKFISQWVKKFDYGSFSVLSDSTHKQHKISDWALQQISIALEKTVHN